MYTVDTYHFVFIGALWKIKYKLIRTADYSELVDKLYHGSNRNLKPKFKHFSRTFQGQIFIFKAENRTLVSFKNCIFKPD